MPLHHSKKKGGHEIFFSFLYSFILSDFMNYPQVIGCEEHKKLVRLETAMTMSITQQSVCFSIRAFNSCALKRAVEVIITYLALVFKASIIYLTIM